MEVLKELVGIFKDLPNAAIWAILFYFTFKLAIVGSVYSVIKLGIMRLYDWAVNSNRVEKIDLYDKYANILLSKEVFYGLRDVLKDLSKDGMFVGPVEIGMLKQAVEIIKEAKELDKPLEKVSKKAYSDNK